MTSTISRTYTILDSEFDVDELRDIVNHGMSAGVSGFIYYSENIKHFDNNEETIDEYLSDWYHDNMGEDQHIAAIAQQCGASSIDELKQAMVWSYVELKADEILANNGYEYWPLH